MKAERIRKAFHRLPENTSRLVTAAIMGTVSGLSAVAFMLLAKLVFDQGLGRLSSLPLRAFIPGSLAVVVVSSLAVGLLLGRLSPRSAGSGIPQLKTAFWKDLGFIELRHAIVKFFAGAISIGGGTSLGREGPSVYIGGAVASTTAGLLGTPRQGRRRAVLMGAAAALAAAFNTPLAAMTFVLEEVLNDLNSRYLGSIILSAVLGAFVVHAIIGRQPAFEMPAFSGVSWHVYAIVPLVSAVGALVAGAFQRSVLLWRERIRCRSRGPLVLRPVVGGLVTWALGIGVFLLTGKLGVFGLGYSDLSDAITGRFGLWQFAGVMMLAKLVSSSASYSWGGCGGIFSPTLMMGGMAGLFLSGLASLWLPISDADRILLCACGMSACFGAAVKAPFTAVLIVFEMTHQFSIVPALMLATLISQAVSRRLARGNMYDELLRQDGHEIAHPSRLHAHTSWKDAPAAAIATTKLVVLDDLAKESVKRILARHPFLRFPVVRGCVFEGVLLRQDMERFLVTGQAPVPVAVETCPETISVHDAAQRLVGAETGALILVSGKGAIRGIVTLHDLVRAQVHASE